MTTLYTGLGAGVTTNPYPAGQCTWSVWQYVFDHFGIDMPDMPGNADSWVHDAQQKGWTVAQVPQTNMVACWGDDMYPPDGHVAFVTAVTNEASTSNTGLGVIPRIASFTVHEGNFKKEAPYPPPAGTNGHDYEDDRTIQAGSKEFTSVQGFIDLEALGSALKPGGSSPGTGNNANMDPWTGLTAALQQAEAGLEQGVKKAEAVLELAGGMIVMAGGSYALFQAMKGRSVMPNALKVNARQGVRTAGRQTGAAARRAATYRPNEGPPVEAPRTTAREAAENQRVLQGGRRYRSVTSRELGARNRPATPLPSRVTRAGRSRILAGARPATTQEARRAVQWRPGAPTGSRPTEPPF